LTFDVTAHVSGAGHRTSSLYQVWSSPVSLYGKIWRIIRLSINRPRDPVHWPFDL